MPHQHGSKLEASHAQHAILRPRRRVSSREFTRGIQQPRVEIGAELRQGEILCHVRDNGIGIQSEYLERVFNLFERLDTRIEGTGIGLALAKRIVEFHDGRIWAESTGLGEGSTFWFSLPAHKA